MSTSTPEFAQLTEMVRRMPGRKLMPERELSSSIGISRSRLRQLLKELEAEGKIQRRQGSGTYVVDESSATISDVLVLVDRKLKLGDDPFFSAVAEHIQHALQIEGVKCTLHRFGSGEDLSIAEDGVITLGLSGREVLEGLGRKSPPAVGMFLRDVQLKAGARVSTLDLDDVSGGKMAAERLLSRGCRHLIFIGHNSLPVSEARLTGVRASAQAAGVPLRVIDMGMNYVAGLEVGRLLELPPMAGVIAANDWLAVGLRGGLASRGAEGTNVPICSFDGLSAARGPSVAIDSFAAPLAQMASDAVGELRRLAASPGAVGRSIIYPLSLSPSASQTTGSMA